MSRMSKREPARNPFASRFAIAASSQRAFIVTSPQSVDATMVWKTATERLSALQKAMSQERKKSPPRAAASGSRSK